MRRYILFLLGTIACLGLVSLGFRGGSPKNTPAPMIGTGGAPLLYYLCCCDTGMVTAGQPVAALAPADCPPDLSQAMTLVSSLDSVQAAALPDTLIFAKTMIPDGKGKHKKGMKPIIQRITFVRAKNLIKKEEEMKK